MLNYEFLCTESDGGIGFKVGDNKRIPCFLVSLGLIFEIYNGLTILNFVLSGEKDMSTSSLSRVNGNVFDLFIFLFLLHLKLRNSSEIDEISTAE